MALQLDTTRVIAAAGRRAILAIEQTGVAEWEAAWDYIPPPSADGPLSTMRAALLRALPVL